jgi:hypothetical protein
MAALFSHVAGIFYILICGLVLAMFTALLEFCYKVCTTAAEVKGTAPQLFLIALLLTLKPI